MIPVIVLSKDSMGFPRCEPLKEISRNISGLIHNPTEHMSRLNFLFTKFESSPKGQETICSKLREVYQNLNEKDRTDKNYMKFWEALGNKVAN